MATVMAMKGRYLRGYHNSSFTQLQSQPKSNQSGAFPNINALGNSKDKNNNTDNNFRGNNIIGNELLNETEFRPTNLPAIVSPKKWKAKSKKSSSAPESSETLVLIANQEESAKETLRQDDSKSILRVSVGVKAKGKLITGLPMHKRSKSQPITYMNDGPLWEVQNSRVYLPETTNSQHDFSGRNKFTKNNRVCSCGVSGPKHCMLHLMEVVQKFRKPRNKQVKWVPMSLCTTYV